MSTDNQEVLPAEENKDTGEVKPVTTIMPTVGRMVYYKMRNGEIRPAVIVKVWDHGLVNLQVFTDGMNDGEEARTGVMWTTSVNQGDGEEMWDWMPFQKDQAARLAKETRNESHPEPKAE